MKYYRILLLGTVLLVGTTACKKKYPGDSYDFSNKEKNYAKFKTVTDIEINSEKVDSTVISGTDTTKYYYYLPKPVKITVETRVGFIQAVNFTLKLSPTGLPVETINDVIAAQTTSKEVTISFPESKFATDDDIKGTIELTDAKLGTESLRIGYPAVGANTKIKFVAHKPYVLHTY